MVSSWFILVCYLLFAFGCSTIVTQSIGPKNIFIRLRVFAESVGPNFGLLFRCMLCFPTNLGLFFSLFNWFCLQMAITPFNMIFSEYHSMWWVSIVAALMDACLTGAFCEYAYNIYDYIDKKTPIFEDDVEQD